MSLCLLCLNIIICRHSLGSEKWEVRSKKIWIKIAKPHWSQSSRITESFESSFTSVSTEDPRNLLLSLPFTIRRAINVVIAICRGTGTSTRAPAAAIPNCFFRWAILRQKYYGRNNVILGPERASKMNGGWSPLTLHRRRFSSVPPFLPFACTPGILFRRISRESFRTQHFAGDKSWL